jgi:hypothetical protein
MSVNNKHLATILLGAAAAFGAYKYSKLTEEEKQKLTDSLKDKFHKLKDEAEGAADKAKGYFSDLKSKVTDMFKEHFPGAEQHFEEFFKRDSLPDGSTNTVAGADVNADAQVFKNNP